METIAGRQLASQMSAAAAMERERLKVTATTATVVTPKTESSSVIDVVSMDTPPKLTLSVTQPSDTGELIDNTIFIIIPPAKRSFRGVYCFQPVRDSVTP